MENDIPAGDGKIANLFFSMHLLLDGCFSRIFRLIYFRNRRFEKEEKSICRADSEDVRDLRLPREGEGETGLFLEQLPK